MDSLHTTFQLTLFLDGWEADKTSGIFYRVVRAKNVDGSSKDPWTDALQFTLSPCGAWEPDKVQHLLKHIERSPYLVVDGSASCALETSLKATASGAFMASSLESAVEEVRKRQIAIVRELEQKDSPKTLGDSSQSDSQSPLCLPLTSKAAPALVDIAKPWGVLSGEPGAPGPAGPKKAPPALPAFLATMPASSASSAFSWSLDTFGTPSTTHTEAPSTGTLATPRKWTLQAGSSVDVNGALP